MSSAGASILGVGYLIPLIYLIWSLKYGPICRPESVGREGPGMDDAIAAAHRELPEIPVVTEQAYDYAQTTGKGGH